MYILALIISSLCLAKKKNKTKKRDREQKEERSNSSSIPAARQVNTIQIRFPKHFQHVQIWLVFNTNNFPTHPLNTLQNV